MNSKIIKGLLWMFSGPILLVAVMVFQIIIRFIFNAEGTISKLLNIVSWTMGVAAVVLIIVGPIIGIIIMSRAENNSGK